MTWTLGEPVAPGAYFDMPEDVYHAAPALSSSGIRWLLVSNLDFWARSWMNPNPIENGSSAAQISGTAYHKRILEGGAAFYDRYAPDLLPEEHPDALKTADDIRRQLKELSLKVGGNKPELINRLKEAGNFPIWDDIYAAHCEKHAGKILLPQEQISEIEIAAAMIEKHPDLSRAFSGGHPEVSIFWIDEQTGILCKARLDYLKARAIVDLKTFSNPLAKPIDRAISTAVASGRLHIQATHYMEAVAMACHHGWIEGSPDRTFLFVWQQSGKVPLARGKVFPKGSTFQLAYLQIREAMERFKACREKFGDDPWIDETPIEEFDDAGFPAYIAEG
jgi:hypothetical protein